MSTVFQSYFLLLDDSLEIHDIAQEALKKTRIEFATKYYESTKGSIPSTNNSFNDHELLNDAVQGLKKEIHNAERLLKRVNDASRLLISQKSFLDPIDCLLLSSSPIDLVVILAAHKIDQVKDEYSLSNSVVERVRDVPKKIFLEQITNLFMKRNSINKNQLINTITNDQYECDKLEERLWQLILSGKISIKRKELEPSFFRLLEIFKKEGIIPEKIDEYLTDKFNLTTSQKVGVKKSMLDYFMQRDLINFSDKKGIDPYLPIAYDNSLNIITKPSNTNDPINSIYGGNTSFKLNFSVNRFDEIEQEHQEIIKANIQAAGMLDYIYYFDCHFHAFDVANLLIMKWASGTLDIPEGETAQKLYRFLKRRDDRNSPEERAMLYKRVLNKGDGQLLQNMVVNEALPIYWEQLMAEMLQYIQKSEGKSHSDSLNNNGVSRTRLYQLTRNLQHNLTEHMTGMAHLQVQEDYAHLQEALDIIKSEEIRNYFGGRRQTLWDIIERIVKEGFGVPVQTQAIKTLAIQGNKVFEWIAQFDEETITGEQFNEFRKAAEAWIIAQTSLSSGQLILTPSSRLSDHSQTTASNNGKGLAGVGSKDNDFDDW